MPLILVQSQKVLQRQRRPLPFVFYAAALYILLRLGVDIVLAEGGRNNLYRVLFEAIWPFFFGFLFHHYGNLATTRAAVVTVFILLFARSGASVVGYITSAPIYIPGIDYVLSIDSDDSLVAMRGVGLSLLMVTFIAFHSSKSATLRAALIPLMMGVCALVVMGRGRFSTFLMLLLPMIVFAWSRRWILLFVAVTLGFGILTLVNVAPQALDKLDPSVARSFSGLIIGGGKTDIQQETTSSDEWHEMMRKEGYERWTKSPKTVILGYGIRATPDFYTETKAKEVSGEVIKQAANLGSFENGLWAVLAIFGLVGAGLYTLLFIYLWRQVFPYFLRRPVGTFWEGMIFWAVYASVSWYGVCYFQGSFPSTELVLMILAADMVQDGKLERRTVENRSPAGRMSSFPHLSLVNPRT